MKKKTEPEYEMRDLRKLLDFPRQADTFVAWSTSPAEDEALAENIRENGLQMPIEVLPVNSAGYPADTIVIGHRRRTALLSNDVTEHEILVRYDLADATANTIELEFLNDNDQRRHLSPLDKARVVLRRYELQVDRQLSAFREEDARDVCRQIAERLEMSEKNARRYYRVLQCPLPVQESFEQGRLSLQQAANVALLERAKQRELAADLAAGDDPTVAVAKHRPARPRSVATKVTRLVASVRRAVGDIELTEVNSLLLLRSDEQELLRHANRLITRVLKSNDRARKAMQEVRHPIKRKANPRA